MPRCRTEGAGEGGCVVLPRAFPPSPASPRLFPAGSWRRGTVPSPSPAHGAACPPPRGGGSHQTPPRALAGAQRVVLGSGLGPNMGCEQGNPWGPVRGSEPAQGRGMRGLQVPGFAAGLRPEGLGILSQPKPCWVPTEPEEVTPAKFCPNAMLPGATTQDGAAQCREGCGDGGAGEGEEEGKGRLAAGQKASCWIQQPERRAGAAAVGLSTAPHMSTQRHHKCTRMYCDGVYIFFLCVYIYIYTHTYMACSPDHGHSHDQSTSGRILIPLWLIAMKIH